MQLIEDFKIANLELKEKLKSENLTSEERAAYTQVKIAIDEYVNYNPNPRAKGFWGTLGLGILAVGAITAGVALVTGGGVLSAGVIIVGGIICFVDSMTGDLKEATEKIKNEMKDLSNNKKWFTSFEQFV